MANHLADMPHLGSDSDSSYCSERSSGYRMPMDMFLDNEGDLDAESCWYPEPSSLEGLFDSPQVQLVFAAFRRRHRSISISLWRSEHGPLSSFSSAAFKQELWDILSDTHEPPAETVRKLTEGQGRKAAICGKIWGKNDLAYRCIDCGTGPCSAICAECFINGDHQNHNYIMYQSSAGGCCDCGDADAWLPSGNCCFHSDTHCRLLQSVPPTVAARFYTMVSSVLWLHCASISFGNYEFADDVIDWLLGVAESCDIFRELVGDVFIQRLPPGDPESLDIACASRCIQALILFIESNLQVSVPIPVSFFALHRHVSTPLIPNVDAPSFPTKEAHPSCHALFMSFINTHLFCLEKSNQLLLTIVLLPAVKNVFGDSFVCRYRTMIQIITQQPLRRDAADNEFCLNLQDQMIDLSVQLLSNARIVQHLVTHCSYFSVLFSSYLEALNRAVIPKDPLSAFVLPSLVCIQSDGFLKRPDIRTVEAMAINDRITQLQSGFHVDIPSSYHVCRLENPQEAFTIPLNIGAKLDSAAGGGGGAQLHSTQSSRPRSGNQWMALRRVFTRELSLYIQELKDRTAFLQRNFGGITQFPLTGGFPIPGTLQVDHIITDTGPDKKRLHVITSDLSNVFFHHDAVAAFLEDANAFEMFLNVAKLLQFADGQLMFVHRHIENVSEDKWIRGLNCEREHFSNIMSHFTSALVPINVYVPSGVDRSQPQAPSSLPSDRQISILFSCLRRAVIFLLQYLTARIQQDDTFSIPMWLKHNNQLLEHFDSSQFVTCCIFHPVSFHLPIHRTLSYFLALLTVHKQFITDHSPIRELLNPSFAALALQHPLFLLTAVCQARLNMWVRNGNMMHYRSWFYMHNFVRDQFINSDGFLLQASCAIIDPDAMWTRVLASFGFTFTNCIEVLQSSALWFFTDQSETAPALFEGSLMLMLSLLTGSWSPALVVGFSDSDCDLSRIRTEICSLLSIKDKTYSELQNILPRAVSSHPAFDSVLESITTFTTPSSRTLKEGSYRLLPSVFEHHFSAVRVYFSAYRLSEVEAAILNWSSNFNSSSMKADTCDATPRKVRFVCSIDDPIASAYYPLTFCDTFWRILRCLCFSLCSSFDQKHHSSILHLPAAFAQAAVDAALRSGREHEVFHKMHEPVATFAWKMFPEENRELIMGGCTPVLTSIYDSLHAIKVRAESDKNLVCLALAYNYALFSIEKLSAVSSELNGAAVRSRESDPSISRKRSTAMAARQNALARIRLLQQKFSCSLDESAMSSSPLHRNPVFQMPASDLVHSLDAVEPDHREFQKDGGTSPALSDENEGVLASTSKTTSQSSFGLRQESLEYPGDDFCADDLGCCCICTMEAGDNDPLGLLVSINPDPLRGSFRTFPSSSSHADPLSPGVGNLKNSALIRSCGHAVHVSCMQSWLYMHHGPSSQFSDGFPCPLCRSQRNGVIPFAPRSLDILIENVLSSYPSELREHRSALNDVVAQAVSAFSDSAESEDHAVFDEARESFLQTCEDVVFAKKTDFEIDDPCNHTLFVQLLHWHARFFRSCAPYAESHRANSLVFCLLRRLNSYQICRVLCSSGRVDALSSHLGTGGLTSCLNDSDYMCLRSIIIAATMFHEPSPSTLFETSSEGSVKSLDLSLQNHLGLNSMNSSAVDSDLSPSVAARYREVTCMTPITSFRRLSASDGPTPTLFSMTGKHFLTCRSHIVATLVATVLPSNSHAKCLTAALLLLHVVAGFCPHLFKPASMSQPLGMIELANRTILAIVSSGSIDAIGQRLAPLTQALHDDQKLLVSSLIAHTMQFVCDIFLMTMTDFAALVVECSDHMNSCLNIWAELLSPAVLEENLCTIARFNAHSGFSCMPDFIRLPSTFQELVWEHRRSNCCVCSESSMRKKELCVCLFCGAVMCCNTSSNVLGADLLNSNRCFLMHTSNCCGPPALGVAVCIGDTNAYLFRSTQPVVSWGSLYLDKHGRADSNLRRIQGLTLSVQRLELLRSQLLLRSFPDNTAQPS